MRDVTVSSLHVYPIKSCQGVDLLEARVMETGFELDREFMLVDAEAENRFITQRTEPRLAQVRIHLDKDEDNNIDGFTVTTPAGMMRVPAAYNPFLSRIDTEVHGNPCVGLNQGDRFTEFFSDFLGKRVHLLRASREEPRMVKDSQKYVGSDVISPVNFGDGFPFLLTSEVSLQYLNELYEGDEVPMDRFRPNIVIAGGIEPFAEDRLKEIMIGDTRLFVVRACARCKIPSIIQNGERAGQMGTVPVLSDFLASRLGYDLTRIEPKKERAFGQNLMLSAAGIEIVVGDTVEALEAGESNFVPALAA